MNAWFQLLDRESAGMEGSILVSEWNDEVMVVLFDVGGEHLAQFWLNADEVNQVRAVFDHVVGKPEGV